MKPFEINKIYQGNTLEILKTFPPKSIQCCVTSPPYFGLRSYLPQDHPDKQFEIGTEQTPQEYVKHLVEIFNEVKRILRDDGLLWLNLGDSFCSQGGPQVVQTRNKNRIGGSNTQNGGKSRSVLDNLKPKDLIGIPWMAAFALRDTGWWIRSDIIWAKGTSGQKELIFQITSIAHEVGIEENKIENLISKLDLYVGNPMPESIKDRCTRSHEFLFMLAKSKKYFYDNISIMEETVSKPKDWEYIPESKEYQDENILDWANTHQKTSNPQSSKSLHRQNGGVYNPNGRNRRDVWTITTKPFKGTHFATFPEELIIPPILASTSEKGRCPSCGALWTRDVTRKPMKIRKSDRGEKIGVRTAASGTMISPPEYKTIGWKPTCECNSEETSPCIVLDPFMGAGTTAVVAKKLGRSFIGIELNQDYIDMSYKRLEMV